MRGGFRPAPLRLGPTPAHFTVRLTLPVRVSPPVAGLPLPKVPVRITVNVPWLIFLEPDRLNVPVAGPLRVTGLGEKMQLELDGPPLQLSATLPLSPSTAASVKL